MKINFRAYKDYKFTCIVRRAIFFSLLTSLNSTVLAMLYHTLYTIVAYYSITHLCTQCSTHGRYVWPIFTMNHNIKRFINNEDNSMKLFCSCFFFLFLRGACFLSHRSYLANNLAVNSLLGPSELDRVLPIREIKVFVGTWNMNGQHPPK